MALVELDRITKAFGRGRRRVQALRGISLTIARGETLALVGESGSGKSTLGRIALRLVEADEGTVRILDRPVRELSAKELRSARRDMQMIFQDPFGSLDPRMVIGELVAEPMTVHGIGADHDERLARAVELLERVGLDASAMERFPYEFSGGQLQRVAIARALATDPKFLVCDEPVAALDVSVRAQVLNLLTEVQRERGLACLFITHDLSLVRAVADRVAVIHHGAIVECGPAEEVYEHPRHPYTQALLSAVPGRDPDRRSLLARAAEQPAPQTRESTGCTFANRCPLVMERCWTDVPTPHVDAAASHEVEVACHHLDVHRQQALQ
ncbi:ABC transporter ATP-binding protein [Streptomyces mangrovisoli]|uniref:ABC transporter domain-containing protein n=1 Tax=Streptomyces mangrovisoli TaxID=1428628 RepID=A0A1J4NSD6_9ACTN|nr:oligopeptide/dipeptide ABC transporter ATP-binding protein [Streptomyces mangrovisoli]OIJ65026.1 hypothetical protein WN71_025850 [Streptomyces mangrovisoli]